MSCGEWVTHDLSTFVDEAALFGSGGTVTYSGGALQKASGGGGTWGFAIPSILLSQASVVRVEITFAVDDYDGASGLNAYNLQTLGSTDPVAEAMVPDDFNLLSFAYLALPGEPSRSGAVFTSSVGPGVYAPGSDGAPLQDNYASDVVGKGYLALWFSVGNGSTPATQIVQIRTMLVCDVLSVVSAPRRAAARPLRQFPRSDGLGMSSHPRLYPTPRSAQASNRRAGGYN